METDTPITAAGSRLSAVRVAVALALAGAAVSLAPTEAAADGTVPLARRLFNEGVEAARKSDWTVALDRFGRSYQLAPRTKTLFNLAGAQMKTDHLVDASESYRRFLRETRDRGYEAYRKDARELVAALERRIPFVTLRVIGLSPGDRVVVDARPFPAGGLGESMPIDPGLHAVRVERGGQVIGRRSFTVGEGGSERVEIVLQPRAPLPGPDDPAAAERPSLAASPPPDDRGEGSSVFRSPWFWTAVAVVAAGGTGAGYFLIRRDDAAPTPGTLGRGVIDVAP